MKLSYKKANRLSMCRPAAMLTPLPFALLGQPGDRIAFRESCWKKVHSACKWPLLGPQESRGLEARRGAMPYPPGSFMQAAAGVAYVQPWEGLDNRRGEERAPAGLRQGGRQPCWLLPV